MKKFSFLITLNMIVSSCSNDPVDCGNMIYKINCDYDTLIEELKKKTNTSEEIFKLNQERSRKINEAYSACIDIRP